MEGYDWIKLRSEVREIRENTVNPRSRTTYLNSYSRFLAWAAFNRQSYVSGGFIDTIGHVEDYTEQQLCAHVKQKLAQDRTTPPLDFDKLQAQDFVTWLVTLKRRDGGPLSYSAPNTYRAALFNLYRDFGFTMAKTLESELANHFKGLKKAS
ncbi:hypothetical protein F442_04154 [Phytophthora nicotianae P10297]|uniref:Uncharacterized protein n=1 Tax=Phytophthora nicotianae P10297 TaxID=1317064 RepID=W2ZU65_PHYNI|nr:hypothetical protein F442_04154 [Phytophthora nicotianae P10297]